LNFTVPSSVGPSGATYGVSIQLFQTDGSKYSGKIQSDIFNLSSATGNWSNSQLSDYVLSSPDTIPCSSFACVKDCSDMVWTNNTNLSGAGETGNSSVYRDCAEKCPGVTIPRAQNEAASTTTSLETNFITYGGTYAPEPTEYTMMAPVCPATTSSQDQLTQATESSSTRSATSPTKSSAAFPAFRSSSELYAWIWKAMTIGAAVYLSPVSI